MRRSSEILENAQCTLFGDQSVETTAQRQRAIRLFAAGIVTETNAFSPLPTDLQDFEIARSGDPPEVRSAILMGSSFARYAGKAAANRCSYDQGIYAFAKPAGITARVAYENLRGLLLDELRDALPLDGVLLTLHGSMVADGYIDCESDLTSRVRRLVGRKAKIGVLLDLHCDLPDELVEAADAIVTFKEYPHIDIDQSADELAEIVIAAARGHANPTMAVFDCRMIGLYPTSREPMRSFVSRMRAAERRPGILSVSLGHGFPWGDAPATGTRMLVVSDGDQARAETLAAELGREFFSLRYHVGLRPVPMTQALDEALSIARSRRPVVIADVSDNAGGGAPSDSTFVLRELLERKVESAALGLLWDPIAVQQAFEAGEGTCLTLRLGGKMGSSSGEPLDITVRVRALVKNLVQRWPQSDGTLDVPCGACACLSSEGVDVIVGSVRHQVFSRDVFTAFGIRPRDKQLLVVKSANHFYAAFAPIAAEVIYLNAPGALNSDPRTIPYRHADTHKFPWLDDPWTST